MKVIFTAWISYLAAVTMIYSIGEKAANFLSKEILSKLTEVSRKDHPLSPTLEATVAITISIVDRALSFRKESRLFVPRISRSILFSLFMLLLISYPLRGAPAFFIGIGMMAPLSVLFETPVLMLSPVGLVPIVIFVGTNILSDYFSFMKTRTLMARFLSVKFPYRELIIVLLDVVLSGFICIVIPLVVSDIVMHASVLVDVLPTIMSIAALAILVLANIPLFSKCSVLSAVGINLLVLSILLPLGTVIAMDGRYSFAETGGFALMYAVGPAVFAIVTSLGIAIISMFVALMQLVKWAVWKIENQRIWRWLNFEEKPSQAAAVVLIVLLTLVYWPIAIVNR